MRHVFFLTFWLLAAVLPAAAQPVSDSAAVVRRAQQHVERLTAPSMQGRGYGEGGHRRAAEYIRRQFKEIGLEPVNGDYTQPFQLRADVYAEVPSLSVDGRPLEPGTAFLPAASTAAGQAQQVGPVVEVDAGLVLPEQGIDAYEEVSAEGAVVVMQANVPDSVRRSKQIPRQAYSRAARIQHAADAGARAVAFLVDDLIKSGRSPYDAPLPVLQVKASAWPDKAEHVSYDIDKKRDQRFTTQNVLGKVPGTAHPDSIILLTAHYDHVGALGDSLYFPGANDNASGVAMLLSLARYFEEHPLPYTLVLVAFSGEEAGLLGSRYFTAHPPVDLQDTRFILNFDMVASGRKGIMAVGGVDYPGHFSTLQSIGERLEVGPVAKRRNAPNSDHYFIMQQGVPGFFLYTRAGTQPYHHVNDVPATLEWEDFWHVYQLSRAFLKQLTGASGR